MPNAMAEPTKTPRADARNIKRESLEEMHDTQLELELLRATHSALNEAKRQKDALYQLTDQLQRATSIEGIYDAALDAIVSGLRCERASILLYDNGGVMRFV